MLLLGIANKPNVDDLRWAPGLEIWVGLARLGGVVSYHDPYVPVVHATRRHPIMTDTRSASFTAEAMAATYDAVVVVTHTIALETTSRLQASEGLLSIRGIACRRGPASALSGRSSRPRHFDTVVPFPLAVP